MRIATVDLDSKRVKTELVSRELQENFIGGFGVGLRLACDIFEPKRGPLDPENPIVLSAGVLCGTHAPGSSRLSAITKYPLTNSIAMGNGGMRFGYKLHAAGFEHMIIRGRANNPTVLKILDQQIEFLDAKELWGKDLYETTDCLWDQYGEDWSVIAIGQSGENLVKISLTLVDKISSLGKGGLAAVMGSKNLKALIANGSESLSVSDPARFAKIVDKVYDRVRAIPGREKFIELGMEWKWDNWYEEGFPVNNSTEVYSKKRATELYGPEVYLEKVKIGRAACPSCPLPDKEIMEVSEGKFRGLRTFAGGFTGRAYNYGIRCGAGPYDRVLKLHDTANRLGICSHSFSALFDFAVELFEQGKITRADTGGIELKRDFQTALKIMKMTAFREGFGVMIADGYNAFIERFGESVKENATQCKGMDMLYEPRLTRMGTKTFAQVVNPRGGHHQPGVTPSDSLGKKVEDFRKYCERTGVPEEAMERIFTGTQQLNVGRLTKHSQEFYTVLSCMGICSKAPIGLLYSLGDCAELFSSFTGIELTAVEMKKAAERIWNLYKLINVKEGFGGKDDEFPEKWLIPMKDGEAEKPMMDYFETGCITRESLQNLLKDYYDECGWAQGSGIPTTEKIEELGLKEICDVGGA